MSNKFERAGHIFEYTASGDVAVNSARVVGTGILGVALIAGVSGDIIPHAIEGVFTIPKVSAAVITKGQQVLWDVSAASGAGEADDDQATPATGDFLCGMAAETAGNGVTEIAVHLNKRAAAVT